MTFQSENGAPKAPNSGVDIITRDDQQFTEVKEGLARLLVPFSPKNDDQNIKTTVEEQQKVFYNPIQQFNRDLTVLAIKAYGEETVERKKEGMRRRGFKRKRAGTDPSPNKQVKQDSASTDMEVNASATAGTPTDSFETEGVATTHAIDLSDTTQYEPVAESKTDGTEKEPAQAEPIVGEAAEVESEKQGQTNGPAQERQFRPPTFSILDALSATGLRALRFAQELPFVTSVTANDLSPSAVEAIRRNAQHNGVGSKINATKGDARSHLYSLIAEEIELEHATNPRNYKKPHRPSRKYDVIDLDPYGTAAPFFDSAIPALKDEGLLCVTCTDSGVWATHGYAEKAFALYGGVSVKGFWSHEAGLRLILNAVASTAARHGMAIEPLLSLSVDYYCRLFIKIKKSPASVKFLPGKTMVVYNCDSGCGAWETQVLMNNKKTPNKSGKGAFYKHSLTGAPTTESHCPHCGYRMHVAGPMYAGPIHDPVFIQKILDCLPGISGDVYGTKSRVEGVLSTALEECLPSPEGKLAALKEDATAALDPAPFFIHPPRLASALHCTVPDDVSFRGALRGLGFTVGRSHCKPGSIKTDAPWAVIWHIMREWVRQKSPVDTERIKSTTATYKLLRLGQHASLGQGDNASEVDKMEVVFDKSLGRDHGAKKLIRYQVNPRENWGPQKVASRQ